MAEVKKILIVDDELVMLGLLRKLLETEGFEVHLAQSAAKALELSEEIGFDLVITDILMPGMNGFELIKRIREIDSSKKIIALTALAEHDFKECAAGINNIKYLGKPFSTSRLVELVKHSLAPSAT